MTQQPNRGEIVIYRAPDGALVLPVKTERESVWLTQNQIAELFGVKKAAFYDLIQVLKRRYTTD